MQALILAAGRGSRLGKKSNDQPKCLLEVGRRPLIAHQLECLAEAGVAPVAMVIGYCADEIRETIGIQVEYIENKRWSVTNSLYSYWLARDWVKGPVLVLNSDTVFHPEILDRLLSQDGDAIAYDSGSGDAREHMKVRVDNGFVVEMSKQLPVAQSCGENVGFLKFTEETARRLFETAGALVEAGEEKNWLSSAVQAIAREDSTLHAVDIVGLPWGEIDSSYDLDRVRKDVYPAIQRTLRRRTPVRRIARWAALVPVLALFGYLAYATWVAPASAVAEQVSWEVVELSGAAAVRVRADGRERKWWLAETGGPIEARVTGAGTVRIESRVVFSSDRAARAPYVLEVGLDGNRVDWYKSTKERSKSWRVGERAVGKRGRIDLAIPGDGAHVVQVRLVAADSGSCLVRVRREAVDDDPN